MKNTLVIIFIVLMAGSLYALTLKGVYGNPDPATMKATLEDSPKPFELSPERGRFAHVMALATDHTYALSPALADFVYPDVGWYDGRFYSFFAPGVAYLAVPFYLIGAKYNLAQAATFGFISLASIGALIFLFLIGRKMFKLPLWAALAAVVIFAFGSTSWSYAITLYQHQLTTLFILSAFYGAWRFRQGSKGSWLWAAVVWLDYGLAIAVDYPNIVLLLPVMLYFASAAVQIDFSQQLKLKLRGAFFATAIVFVAIMGLHFYHNAENFGSWHSLSSGILGYKTLVENNLTGLDSTQVMEKVHTLEKNKNVVKFLSQERVSKSFTILMFSTDRGLFLYCPIFILAILGIIRLFRKINLETGVLLGLVAANLFVYSSWGDPWGGWAYGTRYLIPAMSILSLFAAYWISRPRFSLLRRFFALVLFLYSSAVAVLGAVTTNAIPPKLEAIALEAKYNYFRNLDFLRQGKSGSLLYNTYFSSRFTLPEYFLILYAVVVVVFIIILFVLPLFEHGPGEGHHDN